LSRRTATPTSPETNSQGSDTAESAASTIEAAPVISGVPTISGTETVGSTLTATAASVTGTPTPTRTWQWQRSADGSTGWANISGATASTYTLVSADLNQYLRVSQIETNTSGGQTRADSAESAATGQITDLSEYAANGFEPDFVVDESATSAPFYRSGGSTVGYSDIYTTDTTAGGLSVQNNSSGNLVWGPHNVFAYSNDIDNALSWASADSSATASGSTVTSTSGTGGHSWERANPVGSTEGIPFTFAAKLDPGTHQYVYLLINVAASRYACAVYDLSGAGSVTETSVGSVSGTIESTSISANDDGSYTCRIKASVVGGSYNFFTGFAESATGNTFLGGGRVDWQSAASGTETYDIDAAWAYRSDLGGMANVPSDARDANGETDYVPTTTAAKYLIRRRHYRYNGTSYVPTLLHEPVGATNVLDNNTDLSAWSGSSLLSPGTETNGVVPQRLTADGTSGSVARGNAFTKTAGSDTWSVRLKKGNHRYIAFGHGSNFVVNGVNVSVIFDLDTGLFADTANGPNPSYIDGYSAKPIGPDAYEIQFYSDLNASNYDNIRIGLWNSTYAGGGHTTSGSYVDFWLPQIERGETASSPIPTTGASVTRSADTCKVKAAALPWNTTGVSLLLAGRLTYADEGAAVQCRLLERTVDANNALVWYLATNSTFVGRPGCQQETAGTASTAFGPTANQLTPGAAAGYSIAARHTDGAVQAAQGGTAGTADATPTALADLSTADLVLYPSGGAGTNSFGEIDKVIAWDDDIAEAGLTESTS
jgi:hypothetical protein